MGHAPVANDNDVPRELTLPSEIHHVRLTVAHLERSVAFYTRYFGLREVGRNELRGRMVSAQTALEGVVIDVALLGRGRSLDFGRS
jgi:catechol 2,3-dioxygenase-like lactoylglutathione lyase family enzyme